MFIGSLRKVGLKTAIDKYIEGSLNELLSDDDWSKVFSDRKDYADATMFYEVGRNLANIQKYRDIALEYLKKSAALGSLNAKKYLRDEMKVGKEDNKVGKEEDKVEKDKIDTFLKNPLSFRNRGKKGSDLDQFLNVLAVSLGNDGRYSLANTIRLNDHRTYNKYMEIVEILRKYYTSFNARKYPSEIIRALWELGRVNFPASIRVYKDFSENTMKFRDFRYEDLIKYVVELVKEYEFK